VLKEDRYVNNDVVLDASWKRAEANGALMFDVKFL
jgi:hypothetical protein